MAGRTHPQDKVQVELPRYVRDQLHAYKADLYRHVQRRATIGEIMSAMLSGVPHWQTAVMMDAYKPKDVSGADSGNDPEPDPEQDPGQDP